MKIVLVATLALALSACASAPTRPFAGADPSDPAARVRPVTYQSTIGPYASQRPVEPKSWREQNEGVAPAQKP